MFSFHVRPCEGIPHGRTFCQAYLAALFRGPYRTVNEARESISLACKEEGKGKIPITWFEIVGYEDYDGKLVIHKSVVTCV